jgi:hypothetical protein
MSNIPGGGHSSFPVRFADDHGLFNPVDRLRIYKPYDIARAKFQNGGDCGQELYDDVAN